MRTIVTRTSVAPTVHPFRQFILKIHSRCDLACDYCYVYTMADQRWRARPVVMGEETIRRTAMRIAEHATAHRLAQVDVVLHGGEPLLAGPDVIEHCVRALRAEVRCEVTVAVQTNGVRLDSRFLDLFERLGIRIGVSIDGGATAHDRHRRYAHGAGSYAAVADALRRLGSPRYRALFGGLLCTVDLRNAPIDTYEELLAFQPPAIDFLLPHGNWSAPPPGLIPDSGATPYADWLVTVFDRWYRAPRRETRIRTFEGIINALFGRPSGVEGVGTAAPPMVVVETDGAIEGSDMLASAYHGAGVTGLHIDRDSFDDALRLPAFSGLRAGVEALAAECRQCRLRAMCGGGLHPHRYRAGSGFDNPSVYCADLFRLIDHVRTVLDTDIQVLRKAMM